MTMMGYHTASTLNHLLELRNPKSDMFDMLLHHFVAIGLIVFSYLNNYVGPGMYIAFLHDLADLPGSVTKCFSELKFTLATVSAFFTTMAVWFYSRLVMLPLGMYTLYEKMPEENKQFGTTYSLLVFLGIMCLLHYFWFSMFIRLLINYKTKGATDDKISDVDMDKKKQK